MKIGLVGEAPNDVQSIKNLLIKRYDETKHNFEFMLKRLNGSNLDCDKTRRLLGLEFRLEKPDLVIFIRDLDAILPNRKQTLERKQYFKKSNTWVKNKGLFLLHIYEIEALILADIETFNKIFNTEIEKILDVMLIEEPKEFLKKASKMYNESCNSDIFSQLNFEKVLEARYFQEFIKELDKVLI